LLADFLVVAGSAVGDPPHKDFENIVNMVIERSYFIYLSLDLPRPFAEFTLERSEGFRVTIFNSLSIVYISMICNGNMAGASPATTIYGHEGLCVV